MLTASQPIIAEVKKVYQALVTSAQEKGKASRVGQAKTMAGSP